MTYVLIIVLGFADYRQGGASIVQQFSTFELCEAARKHVVDNLPKRTSAQVTAQGCFKL